MVIDTSAIAAILFDEADAAALERKIADDPVRLMSAATFLEATIVIEARLGDPGGREFDLWLHRTEIEILPVDAEQADMARRAVPGGVLAGAGIRPGSTTATASPMRWQLCATSHCCSRATISQRPT